MDFQDLFKPYSPEVRGDLEKYLIECDGGNAVNNFYGPEYFFKIKDKGFMVPEMTYIRVNQSPIPDLVYFVNSNFLLESRSIGEHNMSCVGAEKGVYNPRVALRNKHWSISGLKI